LVGPDQGTIELTFEAIPDESARSNPSASFYDKTTNEMMEETLMTVGPVVGLVTSTSARVLVECAKARPATNPLQVHCYPIGERSHLELRDDYIQQRLLHLHLHDTHGMYHQSILKKSILSTSEETARLISMDENLEKDVIKMNVVVPKANVPVAFTINGLKPDYIYRVEFPGIYNEKTRVAIIKTMVDNNIGNISQMPHHLNVACLSCNLIERRVPDKDVWERIVEKVDEIDVLLHMGDQIYSDCGHHSWNESVRVCTSLIFQY